MSGSSSDPEDDDTLLSRARRQYPGSLRPRDYEALTHYKADWASLAAGADHRFFILGSFADGDRARLTSLKAYINGELGPNYVAYTMDDFIADVDATLNAILKFQLLAADSHHILAVCEHDHGGQLIEHGLLIGRRSYLDKTQLLKREYEDDVEKDIYSWMQAFGVFEIVEYHDRLHEWETIEEYEQLYEDLVQGLI
ncbi:hypothetical protein NDI56_20985 [Haloarcula sp. S1CR25-12]|uniref:Uncharacterized protein n=1 Tax=Haloarcula saliterrae TaxID=2950534 RepID=A0ABU2FHZ8_9EURY|nr:hypothetical protein [Haloarcula sp. S1CR25-12]MDS0261884.1 hypothetical protein [Haloarcula sp. S1CR25-12]